MFKTHIVPSPASATAASHLRAETAAEVGGEGRVLGGRNNGEKRFVSANERAKFFMCFWGNRTLQGLCLTVNQGGCFGQLLALCLLQGLGHRWDTGPGRALPGCRRKCPQVWGLRERTEAANEGQVGDSGGLGARTSANPRLFPACYLSHHVQNPSLSSCCGQQMFRLPHCQGRGKVGEISGME